jgi:2-polyprenyl-3-methyl-5-hydroxy-6-metoxy-1,4-benzoquinol methylase
MLKQRSLEREILDLGPNYYTVDEYRDCMEKLFRIDQFFGFFDDTVSLLKKMPESASLIDFGCGGGLFLLHLHAVFPNMRLLGVDIVPEAIQLANALKKKWLNHAEDSHNINFQLEKAPIRFSKKSVDVILATLVCHHLNNAELVFFLQQAQSTARKMIILNDLHRHLWSCWGYALLCPLLFRNRIAIHDGLISIKRGFIRSEWQSLLQQAGIKNYQINWRFPFRWQIIIDMRE